MTRPPAGRAQVARSSPASLIVVGTRGIGGIGAAEGEVLGTVPATIVRNAVCDLLVVQTSALHEEV